MPGTPLKIIVGLGNPGPEHLLTRHNAGFWFVDALAAQARRALSQPHASSRARSAACSCRGGEVTLLKPMTYMNRSGLAIRALADYMKVSPARDAGRARRAGSAGRRRALQARRRRRRPQRPARHHHASRRRTSGACASASAIPATSRRSSTTSCAARRRTRKRSILAASRRGARRAAGVPRAGRGARHERLARRSE